jgi:hypothetical protein
MIEKVGYKAKLSEHNEQKQNLEYWLSRPPEERVGAVEILRRRMYGNTARLQRVGRAIKRSQS